MGIIFLRNGTPRNLDPAVRTFPPRIKDSQEISSTSYTMSSKFGFSDIQDIVSPRSIKKELAASQSIPESKGMSTRGKESKRKKPSESSEGLPLIEHQLHEAVSEVRITYPKICISSKHRGS
ncbi:hypothetical protein Hanom_Chr14g01313821 [Helianthus anomalus]